MGVFERRTRGPGGKPSRHTSPTPEAGANRRRSLLRVVILAMAALLLLGSSAAAAAGPVSIELTSTMDIGGAFNTGDFTATAGSEMLCAGGQVTDTRYVWGVSQGAGANPTGASLQVDKTFDCGDGLIFFRLQIHGVFATETFSWEILGGTEAYAGIRGRGEGWTDGSDFGSCTCVVNYYSGFLVP